MLNGSKLTFSKFKEKLNEMFDKIEKETLTTYKNAKAMIQLLAANVAEAPF